MSQGFTMSRGSKGARVDGGRRGDRVTRERNGDKDREKNASPQPPRDVATRRRLVLATLLSAAVSALALATVWPIYDTPWLLVTVAGGWLTAQLLCWGWWVWRWSGLTLLLATLGLLTLSVVPLAVPSALRGGASGFLRGLREGLLSVVTGWKDLLTLHVPVGEYQAVLVPVLVTVFLATLGAGFLAGSGRRAAPWAAVPLLMPLLFAPIFGTGDVSFPFRVLGVTLPIPLEPLAWACWFLLALFWVAAVTGEERRAALKRGRAADQPPSAAEPTAAVKLEAPPRRAGQRTWRMLGGAGALVIAVSAGLLIAPALGVGEERIIPRERIDPLLVVQQHTSPLGSYRTWKQDGAFSRALFRVEAVGDAPNTQLGTPVAGAQGRLRLAVLDAYDGTALHAAGPAHGGERFTRFTRGDASASTQQLLVTVEEGYREPWVPLTLGSPVPPRFAGPRAEALQESLYVNRATGAAIAVPDAEGLRQGDSLLVAVAADQAGARGGEQGRGAPARNPQSFREWESALERMPQLEAWVAAKGQPASAEGFAELLTRLRDRGYLSHGLSEGSGSEWLTALQEAQGARFVPSYAGHSSARIEELFEQLNEQERLAGEDADERALVAAIGDDEQFATAAALLARSLGVESRVVLGVRLGEAADLPGMPACREVCRGEHMAAWVEVRGDGEQWETFDVTPQSTNAPHALTEGEQLPEYATLPQDLSPSESDPQQAQGDAEEQPPEEPEAAKEAAWFWPLLRGAGLVLAALCLALFPLAYLFFARRKRARRRRAEPSPEWQAVGAWQELLDTYRDAGVAVPRSGYRSATAAALGRPRAQQVADGRDRAVFGGSPYPAEEAERLWALVAKERDELRAGLPRWRRALMALAVPTVFARPEPRGPERGRSPHGNN